MSIPSIETHPAWIVYGFFFCVVFFRAQGTYWLGRGLTAGALRFSRARAGQRWEGTHRHFDGARLDKATVFINKWGAPAISLSFLTIGFQTMVNFAAGVMRMNFLRYLISMIVGCLAWAAIYATIGMTVFLGWLKLLALSPIGACAALVVLAGIITATVWHRRRKRSATEVEATNGPLPEKASSPHVAVMAQATDSEPPADR